MLWWNLLTVINVCYWKLKNVIKPEFWYLLMLVLDPRPQGGFQSSPFFVKGLLNLAVMSFFKKEKSAVCLSSTARNKSVRVGGEQESVHRLWAHQAAHTAPWKFFPARKHLEHPHPTPWVLLNTHSKKNCWTQMVLKRNTSDLRVGSHYNFIVEITLREK